MRLSFIGGGSMGEAMVAAALAKSVSSSDEIVVCELLPKRRAHLERDYGVKTTDSDVEAIEGADLILLAVKPQDFPSVGSNLQGNLKDNQVAVSIMAGVKIEAVQKLLGHKAVVRAIPNTPAQIGEGVTVWTSTAEVKESGKVNASSVLAALGHEVFVDNESYIDIATAVSGSGPAYIFLVIEAFIDSAVHIGLRRELAESIVLQTVIGSARYAQASGRHVAELKNEVTSPAGTTTEGLMVLEASGMRGAFLNAIEAAHDKAKELGS